MKADTAKVRTSSLFRISTSMINHVRVTFGPDSVMVEALPCFYMFLLSWQKHRCVHCSRTCRFSMFLHAAARWPPKNDERGRVARGAGKELDSKKTSWAFCSHPVMIENWWKLYFRHPGLVASVLGNCKKLLVILWFEGPKMFSCSRPALSRCFFALLWIASGP